MNNVNLVGRLTKDPELKYSGNGTAIVRFTVAVNRQFKQEGQPEADFINCIAFKKQAENLANFQTKGSLIGIEGRIQTGSYEGQDGKKVFTTDVVANVIHFLSPKTDNQQQYNNQQPFQQQSQQQYQQQTFTGQPEYAPKNNQQVNVSQDQLPF